jgi:hypothetical protein
MELDWATYLGDDPQRVRAQLCAAMNSGDIVFSFGGIGATPVDGDYRETELGVRALPQAARLAHSWLRDALSEAGFTFKEGGR